MEQDNTATPKSLEERLAALENAAAKPDDGSAAELKALRERLATLEEFKSVQDQRAAREAKDKIFKGLDTKLGYNFRVRGDNTPFIQMEIAAGKEIIAEPGSFMFKTEGMQMSMALGDGSERTVFGKLWSATKRKIGGESALLAHFKNATASTQTLALAANQPGEILAINLGDVGGNITCQRGAFMAAAGGTSISVGLPQRIRTGVFAGEGFILQKISGEGHVFINGGGNYATYKLGEGEKLQVDTGCIIAMTDDLAKRWNIQFDKSAMSMLFNESGLFLTTVEGPGQVWVQSMPFSRQVRNMGHALQGQFKQRGWFSRLNQN